jgi:hypothetical protein
MILDPTRLLRLRRGDDLDLGDRAMVPRAADPPSPAPRGTPRFVGRVFNGGAMPSQAGRVFLVNPVRLDGAEAEGSAATSTADGTRAIPVVFVGGSPPAAGDLVVALAVGGRWVAEGGSNPGLACSPCPIPRRDLTVSWAGGPFGSGSTPLLYNAPGQWNSACSNQMLYSLSCADGSVQFAVTYFISGGCPGGQAMSCTSPGDEPLSLILTSSNCSPFYLSYTVSTEGCPTLAVNGFTGFTITE